MELIDKFIKFEYEEDLFNKEIQGVKFWQYIRFSIYEDKILRQKYKTEEVYSILKNRNIIKAVEEYGYSQKEIADYLKVHYSTISRLINEK